MILAKAFTAAELPSIFYKNRGGWIPRGVERIAIPNIDRREGGIG
jgi:hypothetical protein